MATAILVLIPTVELGLQATMEGLVVKKAYEGQGIGTWLRNAMLCLANHLGVVRALVDHSHFGFALDQCAYKHMHDMIYME